MVTINPADCDRTTVYTGECRNFQDTEWITFNSGRRRSPNARDVNTWLIDVANGSFWMRDDEVRNLVRLVPARPITRDDLPHPVELLHSWWTMTPGDGYPSLASHILDAVVEGLNANGGVPQSSDGVYGIPREDYGYVDWPATCAAANERADRGEADRDRWRRAHEIVEGERDQAREQRDEAVARAAAAERHAEQSLFSYDRAHRERDEAVGRAEAAEARLREIEARPWTIALDDKASPAFLPAVTRDEIATALERADSDTSHGDEVTYSDMADAVLALVSGADPVEQLAGRIDRAVHEALAKTIDMIAVTFGVQAPMHVEDFLPEAWNKYRHDLAAHILGREAKR